MVDDLPTPYLTPMNSEAARTTAYPDPEVESIDRNRSNWFYPSILACSFPK